MDIVFGSRFNSLSHILTSLAQDKGFIFDILPISIMFSRLGKSFLPTVRRGGKYFGEFFCCAAFLCIPSVNLTISTFDFKQHMQRLHLLQ